MSIGLNSLFIAKQYKARGGVESESDWGWDPMLGVSESELSRKDWISSGQGLEPEAGQGDLKGVLSQALKISTAESGEVDMPETARTLELLMERALIASSGVRQVAAKTPENLLAKMETPMPVPQATRPRVSGYPGVADHR
ncbi:hypothetical protein FH972_004267 [Carpinus fangiana]|uniref:Uncharacterized protein n=1 Tax=Carpinus fangiana TaxID=176857 RepID=A0A5N6QKI6_9ROSI|nr:hypothetical protein FH972_004267 [Carpinus fangiana]